jgi:uncharacterized protein (DUF362 family)/Pyruvate/2-oxoacid:ferredoxin oxidoreductase delta subunit
MPTLGGIVNTMVALRRCSSYAAADLEPALDSLLAELGGIEAFVRPGEQVAVKVNMLNKAGPERAANTQPEVVGAVLRRIKAAGGKPFVTDSPGGLNTPASLAKALDSTGIGAACKAEGVPFLSLEDDVAEVSVPDGHLYKTLRVGRALAEADAIITLPRLKTHAFQKLTCAVKVLFGAIPGLEKAQFHLKVPDRLDFAHMLVDLCEALKPRLAIVDAVVAMEGEGPGGGTPRQLGALIAGADHHAVDVVAARLVGMDPVSVWTVRAAVERGLVDVDAVEIVGDALEELVAPDFRPPKAGAGELFPSGAVPSLKQLMTLRPYLETPRDCSGCETCLESCPISAIEMVDGRPVFDYDACIRCYCCQELCPEAIIGRRSHWLVRPFVKG